MKRTFLVKILNNSIVQSIYYSPLIDYHQWRLLNFVKENAKKIQKGKKIIDIGAGEMKYKKYFKQCDYKSQDLCVGDKNCDYSEIDIKSTAYKIPAKNASFDYILCTQVLEHLEYPDKAFREFKRLLKNKGKLLLTVPFGFGEHQVPYDFFRYTQFGLKSLGARNGFKLTFIEPQGGAFINIEYILWQTLSEILPFQNLTIIRYFYYIVLTPVKVVSRILFSILDVLDRKKSCTLNYNCIFEKFE